MKLNSAFGCVYLRLLFVTLSGFTGTAVLVSAAYGQSIAPLPNSTGTQVIQQGDRLDITGGQLSGDGSNLFHSFSQFNLDANQTANFLSAPSIQNVLGRIDAASPSYINGLVQLTGGSSNLLLINPAGILFGANARLDIPASFTATTATGIGFANGWFSALEESDYATLTGTPQSFVFDTAQLGALVNEGHLEVAPGQALTLLAGTVVNTGNLVAPEGAISTVAVPGGSQLVRISQDGNLLSLDVSLNELEQFQLEASVPKLPQLITGGDSAQHPRLAVTADGAVVLAAGDRPVTLPTAAGVNIASGTISAAGQTGGSVRVLGERVGLVGAQVDASGVGQGGSVLVGGDYQGQGSLLTADRAYVSTDSTLSVRSHTAGNAGRAIVWADGTTEFAGEILAQGGSDSGNGGFVEVSGRQNLGFTGTVQLDAANGQAGSLLLDPEIIYIGRLENGADLPVGYGPQVEAAYSPGRDDAQLADGQILASDPGEIFFISEAAFENLTGDVTLQATNGIFLGVFDEESVPSRLNPTRSTTNRLTFRGSSLTFETTNDVYPNNTSNPGFQTEFRITNRYSDANRNPIFVSPVIETLGAPLSISVGQITAQGLELVTNSGDISLRSRADDILIGIVDSSNPNGVGGDITIDTVERLTIADSGGIFSGGRSGGGDVRITVSTAQPPVLPTSSGSATFQSINTSSSAGPAGNIEVTATNATGGDINVSSGVGRPGNATLTAPNVVGLDNNVFANSTGGSRYSGTGGNITLISNDVSFGPVLTLVDEFGFPINEPNRLNVDGQLRIQPLSPERTIRIGDSEFGGRDPNALNITQQNLAALSSFRDTDGTLFDNRVGGGVVVGVPNNTAPSNIILVEPFAANTPIIIEAGPGSTLFGPTAAQRTEYTVGVVNPGQPNERSVITVSGFSAGPNVPDLTINNIGPIIAGSGDDALVFTSNRATLPAGASFDGGEGNNVLDFRGYTEGIDADLLRSPSVVLRNDPSFQIVQGTLSRITGVFGGSGSDIIRGDDNSNLLSGGPGGTDILDGRGGIDRIEETGNVNFSLSDTALTQSSETDELISIESATLIGGAGANTFAVQNWTGSALLNGAEAADSYTVSLNGTAGTVTIADTGTAGIDRLRVVGTAGSDQITVTTPLPRAPGSSEPPQSQVTNGAETITTAAVDTIAIDGGDGSDSYTANLGNTDPLPLAFTDSGTSGTDSLSFNLLSRIAAAREIQDINLESGQAAFRVGTTNLANTVFNELSEQETTYTGIEQLALNADTGQVAQGTITVGDINLPGSFSVVSGAAQGGIVLTDDIAAAGGITLTAGTGSISGAGVTLDTSGNTGGAVTLQGNGIQLGAIDTRGTAGTGGNVTLTSRGRLQLDDLVSGSEASIDTTGATASGSIAIAFNDAETPFTTGSADENGTVGAIASGSNVVPLGVAILDRLEQGSITIVNLAFQPEPPTAVLPGGVEQFPVDLNALQVLFDEPTEGVLLPVCVLPVEIDAEDIGSATLEAPLPNIAPLCADLGLSEADVRNAGAGS